MYPDPIVYLTSGNVIVIMNGFVLPQCIITRVVMLCCAGTIYLHASFILGANRYKCMCANFDKKKLLLDQEWMAVRRLLLNACLFYQHACFTQVYNIIIVLKNYIILEYVYLISHVSIEG